MQGMQDHHARSIVPTEKSELAGNSIDGDVEQGFLDPLHAAMGSLAVSTFQQLFVRNWRSE